MVLHPSWNYSETMEAIRSIRDEGLRDYTRIAYLLGGRIMENSTLPAGRVAIRGGIILAKVNSLKTRRGKYIFRELPNVIRDEPYYAQPLIDFCYREDPAETLSEALGIGKKRWIETLTKRELGCVPHSFRHLRATHMGKGQIPSLLHKPTASYLKYYFGWSNIATANSYIDNLTLSEILSDHEKRTRI